MRSIAIVVVLVGCGGPVCEPCAPSTSGTPSSVGTRPSIDEDYACVARMTHRHGEAGATFGFSRHADGTPASRTSSLTLEDATCTFEGRFEPSEITGQLHTSASCRRGETTAEESALDGAPIAFLVGEDVAVRFDCRYTRAIVVEVTPGK